MGRTINPRLINFLLRLSAGLMVAILILPASASAFDCQADMYNSTAFDQPRLNFSPYDKIYIIIECRDLPAGDYSMHANWTNRRRGLIRSNNHDFVMTEAGKRSVYFWFKLTRKGPLASAFTNKDFDEANLGDWQIDVFLNEELVAGKEFTINN